MTAPSLLDLYHVASKHSNYQVLPTALAPFLHNDDITVQSRCERERLAYIMAKLPVAGRHVADIGGNTGFFSFELLARGASRIEYYEGNAAHHGFVSAAAAQLGLSERLHAHHEYVTFEAGGLPRVDATLLLNVLHHLGDDFGDPALAREAAKQHMLDCLATMAQSTEQLVFQLGFNWKGDRHLPLFPAGSKAEMIDFLTVGTAADWTIVAIGIAERRDGEVRFRDLTSANISRDDSLGEFLNRPIFILQSRHVAPGHPASSTDPVPGAIHA